MDYLAKTKEYKAAVNTYLKKSLYFEPSLYDVVYKAADYSVNAGGKRIRPILVLAFCEHFCGEYTMSLPFAAAIEMVHAYSLIHDDLPCMDDDDLRRGRPACHIEFGEANALLAGDGLLTKAFEVISGAQELKDGPKAALSGVFVLAKAAGMDGMIAGQAIDLDSEGKAVSADTVEQIHLLKTGALIRAACVLGGVASGADSDKVSLADSFGKSLGLAFQIKDDILDVISNEKALGKPVFSDRSHAKTTYVTLYGVGKAEELCAEYTSKALDILEELGGSEYLQSLTNSLLSREY